MDYSQIKSLALEEAERMHSEWLTDHLSGESSSNIYLYGEAEDDEIEGVLASELREKLIKGETAS